MNSIIKQIMNNPIKKTTLSVLTIVDGIIFLFCLMVNGDLVSLILTFLVISLIIDGIVWLIVGSTKKCPNCGQMFALTKINSQILSESKSTMMVRNKVRNGYGRVVATVEDNIPAIKREYLNTYKCMYCGRTKQQVSYVKTRD